MSGRIPQAFIDELIARTDIVELIGTRIPLKKAGREFKACCPFHGEKTPSFSVSAEKQFYHCFGCGAHGTALGFLMQYDQLPFPDAVEELASRLALTVPHEGATRAGADEFTQAQYELLTRVTEFYISAFKNNERARRYAAERGLSAEIIERFRIGYAPDSWNALLTHFGDTSHGTKALAAAGLIIERDTSANGRDGYYDRFRDRLMFPIRDTRGRAIAFGGRVLDRGEPKYMNSPDTVLFHKGNELYGLYETRLARTALKRLLIVEGYMDTVRLHQAGLTYAVATLGTATTVEHLRRAFRLVNEIIFAFDGDRAGRAAAWRALQNVLPEVREGRQIRFLFLPDGHDPDSLIGQEGSAAFEQRLAAALPLSEYLVAHVLEEVDVAHADGKARFIALARPLLDRVAAGVYREFLLERIAAAVGLSGTRLAQILQSGEQSSASSGQLGAVASKPRESAFGRDRGSAPARRFGRGGLITQAIQCLLHFPAAASAVSQTQRTALAQLPQPGLAVLCELLEEQQQRPAASMAQMLERWRDRPEYRRLSELAGGETLVADAPAAARELAEAVARLLDDNLRRGRLETLIAKARLETLSDEEKLEIQSLTTMTGKDSGQPPRMT